MAQEIERKFLVSGEFKKLAFRETRIIQGYLCSVPERSVRIRIKGKAGFITVKGMGNTSGASRYEWEKEIPLQEATELMKLCEPGVIDKIRYQVKSGMHIIEVDEFFGENQGLIMAEIELEEENELLEKPDWLGLEVTGDERYYNVSLIRNPFTTW